ncbi:MAG: hypothetical protein HPY45_00405 [Anaerolineae bacterium]|nr:hypothetical protein [Anaerolineae bacterium]
MDIRISENKKTFLPLSAVLLGVSFLSFGMLVPWMGLYADDWPFFYVYRLAGFEGVIQLIAWVRPFAGWMWALITAITGEAFYRAHVVVLLLRCADALLFWYLLRLLWPRQPIQAVWGALIFAVFPAFKQQPLALEYFAHFLQLGFYMGSCLLMLLAAESPRRRWFFYPLGWVFALSMFALEYFFGQEFLRPVFLWMMLRREEPHRGKLIRRVLLNWLPYLLISMAFLYWRVFIHKFPSYQPELIESLRTDALSAIADLVQRILTDLWTVGVGTWLQILRLPSGLKTLIIAGAAGLAAFAVVLFLLSKKANLDVSQPAKGELKTAAGWMSVGLLSMFLAGWPFWIIHFPIRLEFAWDRPTLSFIVGCSIWTAGLLQLLRYRPLQRLLVALLVGLSVSLHVQNANQFRKEWDNFRNFYWQLTWRVPGLMPGTTLVLGYSPFYFHNDKFLVPVLNETYAPENTSLRLPYSIHDFHKLWGSIVPPKGKQDTVGWRVGTLAFESNVSGLLMIAYEPPGCVRLLSQEDGNQMLFSAEYREGLQFSHLDRVILETERVAQPPGYLGQEPQHGWCYYFEKAELARQQGNWEEVNRLGDWVRGEGLYAGYPSEWLVFVDGYLHAGRVEEAGEVSKMVISDDFFRSATCQVWERNAILNNSVPAFGYWIETLGCVP